MNHLLRSLAPLSDEAWQLLDEEAKQRSIVALAARKLVDFSGPHGWELSAVNMGRATPLTSSPANGVAAKQRRVLPLVELRADFDVAFSEIQDIDRGARDIDLAALDRAARQVAVAENNAVFHGWQDVIKGIGDCSPHQPGQLGNTAEDYPARVAGAVQLLLQSGIGGPYGLALGPEQYRLVSETTEHGGYPLFEHLAKILDGPIVWAPGVNGAVVVSLRGGDFKLESGQDLSLGYDSHDSTRVNLYLEESFTFHVVTPEAAVLLRA